MGWKRIKNPEDPGWLEFHREVMSPQSGRCMLKVWDMDFGFAATLTSPDGNRRRVNFDDVKSMDDAKRLALLWATT